MLAQEQEWLYASTSHQEEADDLNDLDTIYSSTATSAESVESLKNVRDLITESDDTAALLKKVGPLTFVGNFDIPPEVLHAQQNNKLKPAQVPVSVAQEGVIAQRINPSPVTTAAPACLSTMACGEVPTYSKSSTAHHTREEHLRIMEYHQHMASYYRQLKLTAEPTPDMKGSVCLKELQRKRGSIHDRSWDEPPQKRRWEDGTEGVVLPDDAVEKLDAIPGIWDLAIEMGFLTVCRADE